MDLLQFCHPSRAFLCFTFGLLFDQICSILMASSHFCNLIWALAPIPTVLLIPLVLAVAPEATLSHGPLQKPPSNLDDIQISSRTAFNLVQILPQPPCRRHLASPQPAPSKQWTFDSTHSWADKLTFEQKRWLVQGEVN